MPEPKLSTGLRRTGTLRFEFGPIAATTCEKCIRSHSRFCDAALRIPSLPMYLVFRDSISQDRNQRGAGGRVAGPAQDMAKKIGEYLKDEAMCKWCPKPGVPTIQMLQCQGLKAVLWYGQICHNSFMYGKTAVECVNLCQVTMKCFTNICMPRDVAVDEFDEKLFENNLKITPKEARDLVKQNIDALKPFF